MSRAPVLSVVIPTFNNRPVLERCLGAWQRHLGDLPVELLVVEDGCRDDTSALLETISRTPWGERHLRWFHEDDVHELRCVNRGFAEARGTLIMSWQDDMFLECGWLIPELVRLGDRYPDVGLIGLSRGLDFCPLDEPIERWEDLHDRRRLRSTVGVGVGNWWRLQEVDALLVPWVVRGSCLEAVGSMDDAFVPTEWADEDLCFRAREAGWHVAVYGYERLQAFQHLGSTTIGRTSTHEHHGWVLPNGQLFYRRWASVIRERHNRRRRTWWRPASPAGWAHTLRHMARAATGRVARRGVRMSVERHDAG